MFYLQFSSDNDICLEVKLSTADYGEEISWNIGSCQSNAVYDDKSYLFWCRLNIIYCLIKCHNIFGMIESYCLHHSIIYEELLLPTIYTNTHHLIIHIIHLHFMNDHLFQFQLITGWRKKILEKILFCTAFFGTILFHYKG